jgi:hypothetical protein
MGNNFKLLQVQVEISDWRFCLDFTVEPDHDEEKVVCCAVVDHILAPRDLLEDMHNITVLAFIKHFIRKSPDKAIQGVFVLAFQILQCVFNKSVPWAKLAMRNRV